MYGLVNQAIEDLVVENYGKEKWLMIKEEAKVKDPFFQSLVKYDDSVTYNLVASSSKILGLTPEQVLEAFGSFWVTYTSQKGYGGYMFVGCTSFRDYILHLNDLHEKIEDLFPKYSPPNFIYEDVQENSLTLVYKSNRVGLDHMLIGLLKGLGKTFNLDNLEIEYSPQSQENPHARFKLRF